MRTHTAISHMLHRFLALVPSFSCVFCLRCSSSWMPQGVFLESNRDECTVSLVYAVHLEKQGSVSFTYQYPDNNIFFEFYVSLRPPPTISS